MEIVSNFGYKKKSIIINYFAQTLDSVGELLQFNTSKLFTQDMKHGGTPLHWSSSREVLLELLARGCDVNAVNFEEKSALHVMVERNRSECVVAFIIK